MQAECKLMIMALGGTLHNCFPQLLDKLGQFWGLTLQLAACFALFEILGQHLGCIAGAVLQRPGNMHPALSAAAPAAAAPSAGGHTATDMAHCPMSTSWHAPVCNRPCLP
jgi:hypothetical protein